MSGRVLMGLPASPGIAAGVAKVLEVAIDHEAQPVSEDRREAEAERALAALAAAATQIDALAAELEARGNSTDAAIVATGSLMAADPGLAAAIRAAVIDAGASAPAAIVAAAEAYANTLAALDDPTLQLRSDDVRSLGRRAARLAVGPAATANGDGPGGGSVLVASDLGPADVAELGGTVRAVALAAGGSTAHAAIVARSLGVPMVVGAGEELLRAVAPSAALVVDGDTGSIIVGPDAETLRAAEAATIERVRERQLSLAARDLPAETVDGHRIRVLANVASPAEVAVALPAGADGVGLLRTELAFLDAVDWPSEEEHRRMLATTLAPLEARIATVRLLDFGGDKTPPFLRGTESRGIALLLDHPAALATQARALVAVAGHTELRVLLPLVESASQVEQVRALFAAVGDLQPAFGAMVETAAAVERLDAIAGASDFLSIGTNDLTHSILGTDRFAPSESAAHHPLVLSAIDTVARGAAERGRLLEVCGEAASSPVAMPLLLGLGVDELSVGAARVGAVRRWVRSLDFQRVRKLAASALEMESAAAVAELLGPTSASLGELGDARAEGVERGAGVVSLGGQA